MNNTNLEDVILQAVDIVASKKIASAGFDKTIQATIVSCVDATIGKYKIKYQDSFWYAYSNDSNISYTNGSNVYILIPNGDMSKDKTILGATKKLGINYITVAEGDQKYAPIGTNVITTGAEWGLCSYEDNVKILYSKQFSSSQNLIQIDNNAIAEYIRNSTYIIAGAYVRTELNIQQQYQGNYGILFGLDFIDNATRGQVTRYYTVDVDKMTGNPYRLLNEIRQYGVFDVDGGNFVRVNMISLFVKDFPNQKSGMPDDIFISKLELGGAISLSNDDLNSCALVLITPKGYIFNKNSLSTDTREIQAQLRVKGKVVDAASQKIPFYWFIQNLSITSRSKGYSKYGGQGWQCLNSYNVIKEATLDEPAIVDFLPGKSTFSVSKSQAIIKNTKYKCVAIYDGSVLSKQITIINDDSQYNIYINSNKGTQFYYDIGSPTLTCVCQHKNSDDTYTDVDVNDFKYVWGVINNVGNFESLPATADYNNDRTYLYTLKDVIQDYLSAEYILYQEIVNIDKLFPNDSTINRISDATKKENVRIAKAKLDAAGVTFAIANQLFNSYSINIDDETTYNILLNGSSNEDNTLTRVVNSYETTHQCIVDNKIIGVNIKNITSFATYKCSVFTKTGNNFIGTASITLTNSLSAEDKYTLVINNGEQVFKYNTHGVAPTSEQNKIPLELLALTFTVYDNLGEPIDDDIIRHCDITWTVPSTNTMLKISNAYAGVPNASLNAIDYKNLMALTYGIDERYNVNKTNNNIQLKVNYNGMNLIAFTDFTFIKQGSSGTNGTDFVCKIVPNVTSGQVPLYPTIYYDGQNTSFNWNNTSNNWWFTAQLWHNGTEPIFKGYQTGDSTEGKLVTILKWEVLKNQYASDRSDQTNFVVNTSTGFSFNRGDAFSYVPNNTNINRYIEWRPANIIKVTLSYDGVTYYGTLPVIVVRSSNSNYRVSLKNNTGFREVLYSTSGANPEYDNHAPFELKVEYQVSSNRWEDISIKTSDDYKIKYDWYYVGSIWHRTKSGNTYTWTEDFETTSSTLNTGDSSKKWLMKSNLISSLQPNQKAIKPVDEYDGECVNTALACRVSLENNGNVLAWIHIPIHMLRNRFSNSALNGWDGNSIELGGANGGTILAPQVGAGVKNSNNAFTGIVIGTAKDPQEDTSSSINNTGNSAQGLFAREDEDVGLFGYHEGSRSIFLDAKTGKAVFGEKAKAQIVIDPSDDAAIIKSGNYKYDSSRTSNTGKGMAINLSEGIYDGKAGPWIRFGNGNFEVDSNGTVTIRGNGSVAGWTINDASFKSNDGKTGINSLDSDIAGAQSRKVNIPSNGAYNEQTKYLAFWAGNNSTAYQFFVSHDGYLRTTSATIGSGTTPIFIGKGDDTNSAIFSGRKTAKNQSQNGFYIGADGLGLGTSSSITDIDGNSRLISKFQVDTDGTLYARRGYIGNGRSGWEIGSNYLTNGKTEFPDATHNGVYIGTNGIALGTNSSDGVNSAAFSVNSNGNLIANKGTIANWTISKNSIRSSDATNDAYDDGAGNVYGAGMYFGKGGLRLGQNFHVNSNGDLYAKNGTFTGNISGSTITGSSFKTTSGNLQITTDGTLISKTGNTSLQLKDGTITAYANGAQTGLLDLSTNQAGNTYDVSLCANNKLHLQAYGIISIQKLPHPATAIAQIGAGALELYTWLNMYNNINMQGYDILNQSDERIKENIKDSTFNALNFVKSVPVKEFRFKERKEKQVYAGFVAQDVEKLETDFREKGYETIVTEDKEGIKNVIYNKFIPILWKAVQELSNENEILKQRIDALEG